MPCAAVARGIADLKYPFNDVVSNNPCGGKAVTSVGGADVTAQNLCQWHYMLKYGQSAYIAPIVKEP